MGALVVIIGLVILYAIVLGLLLLVASFVVSLALGVVGIAHSFWHIFVVLLAVWLVLKLLRR